jgi:hypothetical protein
LVFVKSCSSTNKHQQLSLLMDIEQNDILRQTEGTRVNQPLHWSASAVTLPEATSTLNSVLHLGYVMQMDKHSLQWKVLYLWKPEDTDFPLTQWVRSHCAGTGGIFVTVSEDLPLPPPELHNNIVT